MDALCRLERVARQTKGRLQGTASTAAVCVRPTDSLHPPRQSAHSHFASDLADLVDRKQWSFAELCRISPGNNDVCTSKGLIGCLQLFFL